VEGAEETGPNKTRQDSLVRDIDDPDLFRCVHVTVVLEEELDPGAEKEAREFENENPMLAKTFEFWWQPTTPLEQDFWFIRCDFTDKKRPSVDGYARMPDPILKLHTGRNKRPLYPVVRESALKIGMRSYKLSEDEKSIVLENVKKHRLVQYARGYDIIIPLRDVIPNR
jgi:hypothetical protein